jgi:hypothetical protein
MHTSKKKRVAIILTFENNLTLDFRRKKIEREREREFLLYMDIAN